MRHGAKGLVGTPSGIVPNLFVEFRNGVDMFLALLDGGAQVNIVSGTMLPALHTEACAQDLPAIRGVDGGRCRVRKVVEFGVELPTSQQLTVQAAVVDGICHQILL